MRVLFGIILGVALTIGGAYVYDSQTANPGTAPNTVQRPMVNWDVVDANWHRLTHRVQAEWARLTG